VSGAEQNRREQRTVTQLGGNDRAQAQTNFVVSGVIPPGTALTVVDPDVSVDAEVLDDGYIKVGDHTYEDLDRTGWVRSIDRTHPELGTCP
jgi:hypothetical protein